MERLTEYHVCGAWYVGDVFDDTLKAELEIKAVNRLAAYEDSGLTPEEVARLANPWISVEERLPGFAEWVLAVQEDGWVCKSAVYRDDVWVGCGKPVTHWMSLPEPPKGGAT